MIGASMRMTSIHKKDWALVGITCLLSLVVMAPRILSAQFGLLDDGVLLLSAQATIKDPRLIWYQYQAAGRFLPTALFLRALVFNFAGFSAELWYLWSAIQLVLTTLILLFIARRYQASRLQILLSILLFLGSPSVVENFYTLSKSEVPLLLCVSGAILCASYYPSQSSNFTKILSIIGTFLMLFLGFGAKETAVVFPVMFLGWLIISWATLRRKGESRGVILSDLILFFCSIGSFAAYLLLRYLLGVFNSAPGGYAEGYQLFNIEKLIVNFSTLLGWLIRDFPYLIPAFVGALVIKSYLRANILAFALKWTLWMVVWGGILIPWYILAYYMLPFLFGAAIFGGMIFGRMIHIVWSKWILDSSAVAQLDRKSVGRIRKVGLAVLVAMGALLLIPPVINASAYAVEQLSFDRANWQFIKRMTDLPSNSRLLLDMPDRLEYFKEINLMIKQVLRRDDITIEAYEPPIQFDDQRDIYIASLVVDNQIFPSVRSNHGPTVMAWKACLENESLATKKFYSTRITRHILDIGLHRLLPLQMDVLLSIERDIFVNTRFTYGWDVVQFVPTRAHVVRPGVFQNGVFFLETVSENIRSVVFGRGDEAPLTGDLDGNGYSDLVLYIAKENAWMADLDLDGKEDEVFTTSEMQPGDLPFLGDWDGDGKDTPGFYRPRESQWFFYDGLPGTIVMQYQFGTPDDVPFVGDWNGDGIEEVGIYCPDTGYTFLITDPAQIWTGTELSGLSGAAPVAGYWEATSKSQVALVKDNSWTLYIPVPRCILPNPNKVIQFEYSGIPLACIWKDQ